MGRGERDGVEGREEGREIERMRGGREKGKECERREGEGEGEGKRQREREGKHTFRQSSSP